MEAIGGYFELADFEEGRGFPHQNGILLNTGRNALEYLLRSIGQVQAVYLPYYTCSVVLEPLRKLNIPWVFYHVNSNLEMEDDISPREGEYIIANNYFGIKDAYVGHLSERLGEHLIVDCAQAFLAPPLPGINCFYSARKFVGVADGGVAYLGHVSNCSYSVKEVERTADHASHLFLRKRFGAEAGFLDYQENERKLADQPVRCMSETTEQILEHIDYDRVKARRRENYQFLHEALSKKNSLRLPDLESFACPMVYPFMASDGEELRKVLIDNKIFVAMYWPDVCQSVRFGKECAMATNIIPLPCDQRYGEQEMRRIIEIING